MSGASSHLDREEFSLTGGEKLKRWDEGDDGYRPPQGKAGSALRYMMVGSLGLLITFVSLYFVEWAMTPPKVAGEYLK